MKMYQSDAAPAAIGPYSQAIRVGNLLFCSGQTPVIPGTRDLNGRTIEAQTEQALKNVQAVLASAGLGLSSVVKTTVFLKNFADFTRMNETYATLFDGHRPARSTVEVSRLPLDCLIEIEAIAAFD